MISRVYLPLFGKARAFLGGDMVEKWSLHMHRRLCRVDAEARALGQLGPPHLEYVTGSEEDMRAFFTEFASNRQVLVVELRNCGMVVDASTG
jgi:hypothetical protein